MKKAKTTKRALLFSALALVMCVSMLVGSTFAWFTDSVTSSGNIIKSGKLDVAMYWADGSMAVPADGDTAWKDASVGAIFNSDRWEPGYSEAKHIKIANEGNLAFKYQLRILANGVVSELANVIDVYYFAQATQLTRASFVEANRLGTLSEVLNNTYEKALSATVAGALTPETFKNITVALKMQESAGNEYQNLSIGTDFSIQLIATQYTSESDSFDINYDKNAEFAAQETPSAMVKRLTGDDLDIYDAVTDSRYILDTGYQFEPTETSNQADASKMRYWIADFAVSADRDVPANSMMLAGYYKLYADYIESQTGQKNGWVGLTSDAVIEAGTEINLLEVMNFPVNYEEICMIGNDGTGFRCGAVDLDGSNAGTTLKVELRLYETYSKEEAYAKFGNSSTNYKKADYEADADVVDYYITIGTFTYTFPNSVSTAQELEAALENGGTVTLDNDITVDGALTLKAGSVLDGQGHTLKNVQLTVGEKSVVKNVKFNGVSSENGSNLYSHGVSFTAQDCSFTNSNWDAIQANVKPGNEIVIDGCTFADYTTETSVQMRGIHVEASYTADGDGDGIPDAADTDNGIKVTISNCHFDLTRFITDKVAFANEIVTAGVFPENITAYNNTYSEDPNVYTVVDTCFICSYRVADGSGCKTYYVPNEMSIFALTKA